VSNIATNIKNTLFHSTFQFSLVISHPFIRNTNEISLVQQQYSEKKVEMQFESIHHAVGLLHHKDTITVITYYINT